MEYSRAVKFSRKVQKKAYGAYQRKVKSKLNMMDSGDGNFWSVAKEIGGLEGSKGQAAPDADDLADHFAEKMSNGKDVEAGDYEPKSPLQIPLSSFKVRFKTVEKVLEKMIMNPNKSANGIPPRFWKECYKFAYSKCFQTIQVHSQESSMGVSLEAREDHCCSQERVSKTAEKLQTDTST